MRRERLYNTKASGVCTKVCCRRDWGDSVCGSEFRRVRDVEGHVSGKVRVEIEQRVNGGAIVNVRGFAGAVGQAVAYPFDVVRRRLQVAGGKEVQVRRWRRRNIAG